MENSVHHIVLFELKEDITKAETLSIIDDGIELLGKIPGVINVDLGLKARENRDVHIKNYQLALYVFLRSNADLDIYSPHTNHQEFLVRHKAKWTNVQVIDFFGK